MAVLRCKAMRDDGEVGEELARWRSFDNVVDVYHEIRPGYPAALFDDLFALLPQRPLILEVGPGTGQATRDLLKRGAVVEAVEIGPAMAARLREVVPSTDLIAVVGDFEHVPGNAERFDAVFSATAYHWIAAEAQLDRPAELRKPGGVLAIVDLIQVDDAADHGFFAAAQPTDERYGQGHTGPPTPKRPTSTRKCALRSRRIAATPTSPSAVTTRTRVTPRPRTDCA